MSKVYAVLLIFLFGSGIYSQTPKKVDELEKRGRESFSNRDYDAAIAYFTEVITLTSKLPIKRSVLSTSFAVRNPKQTFKFNAH